MGNEAGTKRANGEPDLNAKPSWEDYATWFEAKFSEKLSTEKDRYETASLRIEDAVKTSAFWPKYLAERESIADRYYAETGYPLFAFREVEPPVKKSWNSFLNKSFRRNVVNNDSWPQEPSEGWCLTPRWFEQINDILRTTLVVKYLDGVEYLANELERIAKAEGVGFRFKLEARDEGYYAAHSYVDVDASLPTGTWAFESKTVQFEIQITTQLQEVIRRLTHLDYEKRREAPPDPSTKWQWDFRGAGFTPNYLGHILHYMEGMIMEVRDRGRAE
ncbi:hypothetical protein ACEXQE_04780 [Herbiconiux sp. P17]|uniref:hypothetical protein n=1 Tax=Herbiconiux wuyangfengii TaxID=3342794 RepID=UPI0035BA900E